VSAIADALITGLTPEQLAELANKLAPYLSHHHPGERLLTPQEAATRLGVHSKTLTRAAAAGRVSGAVRVGKAWRFKPDELTFLPVARESTIPAKLARRREPSSNAADAIRGESR
jgi:excisionase family DNA binding protein